MFWNSLPDALTLVLGFFVLIGTLWLASYLLLWTEVRAQMRATREWERHVRSATNMANHASFPQDFGLAPSHLEQLGSPTAARRSASRAEMPSVHERGRRELLHAAPLPAYLKHMSEKELDAWARDQWRELVAKVKESQRDAEKQDDV